MPRSLFPSASPETRAELERDPTIKLLNEFDWSVTPLGLVSEWSEGLKGGVRLMMVSSTPMVMMVGPQGILIYNDAYARFAGQRHPAIFGQPVEDAWPEIAAYNRQNVERGLAGESWFLHDQELVLNRHGNLESAWLDLHYSPIIDADGWSLGTLCIVHETTERLLTERALARSEERMSLALSSSALVGTCDWDMANNVITANDKFAAMFSIDAQVAGLGAPLEQYLMAIEHEDLPRLNADLQRMIEQGTEIRTEFRVMDSSGTRRWLMVTGRPRIGADGRAYRFSGVAVDVTEQHRVADALAKSELEFRMLSESMPQMVWATRADGYHDYFNARWYDFTGAALDSTDGFAWKDYVHPADRALAEHQWQQSLTTGEPYQVEYRLRQKDGNYRWTLARAVPIRDRAGRVLRWIGTCTDINDSKKVAEERELVAQELSHRIKNIFAVLTGIVSLSARGKPEVRPFAEQLRQRIMALGEAHDFVRPHSYASSDGGGQGKLSELIARLMKAYSGEEDANRVRYGGDDTTLDDAAATPLALLFHELATNANKYGSLANPDGWVDLTGRLDGDQFHLTWKEHGGPQLTAPAELSGFGSKLIELSVEGQMHGVIARHWESDGLRVELSLPVASLLRSNRLHRAVTTEDVTA